MSKIGFIGAGNMGSALLCAASQKYNSQDIYVADHLREKAESVALQYGCVACDNQNIVKSAKYIFLGVKPQVMKDLLYSVKTLINERNDRFVLVTMAAGLSCKNITDFLGKDVPVIRIMPNTPVLVSKGTILYCTNDLVTADEKNEFLEIMSMAGCFVDLKEEMFDAGCAVSGCGPAFVYMFINALIEGGINAGLTENNAKLLACNTVIGAAEMVLASKKTPDTLKTEVCSPGGCTIEGVYKLEDGKLEEMVKNAVYAAYEKSKILGK